MSDCALILDPASGRWHCPVCDPERLRTLPGGSIRRNCGPLPAAAEAAPRSAAEQAPLIAICQACEHFLPAQTSCAKCGCQKVRANLVSERLRAGHCPLGKW